jgi:hypothetical protein
MSRQSLLIALILTNAAWAIALIGVWQGTTQSIHEWSLHHECFPISVKELNP